MAKIGGKAEVCVYIIRFYFILTTSNIMLSELNNQKDQIMIFTD